jgi:hypothetical protein
MFIEDVFQVVVEAFGVLGANAAMMRELCSQS